MRLHLPDLVAATVATAGMTLSAAVPVWSQTLPPSTPLARVDTTVIVGWLSVNKADLERYDNWYSSASAGGTVGWYWTDNLKTELEYAASGRVQRDVYTYTQVGSLQINRESIYHFGTRRLAIGQQYQFHRNVMFHPYVAGGVDLNWESIEQHDSAERIFDAAARQTLTGEPAETYPKRTEVHVRPFATLGFKAYMSPRSYFRTDLKFVIDSGVEEVLFRFGIGVDF
jgi:hypothetical protein